MVNPATDMIVDKFKGFKTFFRNHNKWNEKRRFVFKLKMQSASSAVSPIIWMRCDTTIKPPINTNGIVLTGTLFPNSLKQSRNRM